MSPDSTACARSICSIPFSSSVLYPSSAAPIGSRPREHAVLSLQTFEAVETFVPRIDVQHDESGRSAGGEPDVVVRFLS